MFKAVTRLGGAALVAVSVISCSDGPLAPRSPEGALFNRANVRNPIVFVHGFGANAARWSTMIQRFKADGYADRELHAWTYNSALSNTAIAAQLKFKVDSIRAATGAAAVDIIAHSMGSLSSRYFLRTLGGASSVDAWVSLAGPNHGTLAAFYCAFTSCVEMRPNSPFLRALNSGDETPGSPRYATFRSKCDQVIVPTQSVPLHGAHNWQERCVDHASFMTDERVYRDVKHWITK